MFTEEEHDWFILQKSQGESTFWLRKQGTQFYEAPYIPYLKTTSMEARREKIDQHITSLFGGPGIFHEEGHHQERHHAREAEFEGVLLDDVLQAQRNSLIPLIECEQL